MLQAMSSTDRYRMLIGRYNDEISDPGSDYDGMTRYSRTRITGACTVIAARRPPCRDGRGGRGTIAAEANMRSLVS
jgi:hypothetical protein